MRRKLPSTQALICFESAARHQSFTRAAQELSLTQGAISRQVCALEEFLGIALFKRTQHGMSLTSAGQAYIKQVTNRLNALERDTLDLITQQGAVEQITLACVPTFAIHWLIPRLPQLQQTHPQLVVHIESKTKPFLFSDTTIDAAIFSGTKEQAQSWAGTEVFLLMPEEVIPVCAPSLIASHREVSAHTLTQLPLLQQSTRPDAWRQWFDYMNIAANNPMSGPRFEQYSMQLAAAKSGLGVALMPTLFIEEELRNGSLCIAYPHPCHSQRNYYFVKTKNTDSPALALFETWLLSFSRHLPESHQA